MMRVLFFFLLSVFLAINQATKCLQCSHSTEKPNDLCIEGKVSARSCPTAENSCLISMMTNHSAETGQELLSFSKFSRLCALVKKDEWNCEIKEDVLKCYCNGDGCNDIPAKLLLTNKNNTDDFSEGETFRRIARGGGLCGGNNSDYSCDDPTVSNFEFLKCIDISPPPIAPAGTTLAPITTPAPQWSCEGFEVNGANCYTQVDSRQGQSCAEEESECVEDDDITNPGGPPSYKCTPPVASGFVCSTKMSSPCIDTNEECLGSPKATCQVRVVPYKEESELNVTTPLENWVGSHTWATYHIEHRECWNHSAIAKIVRGADSTEKKRKLLEENTCRLDYGLECLNISDTTTSPPTFKFACRCLLSLGPGPALLNPPDPTAFSDDYRYGSHTQCFIPAGKGYSSECFGSPPKPIEKSAKGEKRKTPLKKADEDRLPPYESFGFPLPFGDPAGIGPDPPNLADTYFGNTEKEKTVQYVKWNSVFGRCVPHAECREAGTYIGRRCQCKKGFPLIRSSGLCSYATKVVPNPGLPLILISTIALLFSK